MAAASGGVNTSVAAAGKSTTANGLVISIGLEKYIGRANAALQATLPLVTAMEKLTRTAQALSNATEDSIQLEPGKISGASNGLKTVATESSHVIDRFSRLAGGSSIVVTRLMTLAAIAATLAKWKAVLTGNTAKVTQGLGSAATAAGVLAGRITPAAGALQVATNASKFLPQNFRSVGTSALGAGVALGLLSGGIGPISGGLGLLKLGLSGIPGKMGTVAAASGALALSFGVAKVAMTALSVVAVGFFSILTTTAPALTFGVKLAAEAQQAQIAFEVMLGSADRAEAVLGQIRGFAIKTPFGEEELIGSARALIAFGEAAGNVVPALQRIGDVSSGINAPIGEIAEIYGKARVQGRLFAQDINQLTGRGIPVIQELAKQFGVLDSRVKELVADGVVEFRHLEQAFVSMTTGVGRYAGMTEKQSKSLAGKWSTFKDSVAASLRRVGEEFIRTEVLTRAMESGAQVVKTLEPALIGIGNIAAWMAEKLVNAANVFVWFVGLIESAVTFTSAFATAMGKLGLALAAVATAVLAVVAAKKAYIAAQTMALALSGPKAWIQLAAGLGIASAAYYGISSMLGDVRQAAASASEEAAKLSNVKPMNLVGPDQLANLSAAEEYIKRFRPQAEQLQAELQKVKIAFSDNRSIGQARANVGIIDEKTGVFTQIANLTDELDILTGKATEAEVRVRSLMKAGVTDFTANVAGDLMNKVAEAKKYNEAIAESQKKAKQYEEKIARDAEDARDRELKRRKDRAKEIIEANKSAYQKLADQLKENADLVKTGDLSKADAIKANKRLVMEFATGKDRKDNTSTQANTEEAMKSIIAAITLRDPQAKVEDLLASIDAGTFTQNETLKVLGDKFENGWKNVKQAVIPKKG